MITRVPAPALRPWVRTIWATELATPSPAPLDLREHVLPTGLTHVVIRLAGPALRVFDPAGQATSISHAVLGGPRSSFYVKAVDAGVSSVGALLLPGAVARLFGVSAREITGAHVCLEDVLGPTAHSWRAQLLELGDAESRGAWFEARLAERLGSGPALHPAVVHALDRLPGARSVAQVVAETGYSHRRFIALFNEATGLTPKRWHQLLRFRAALHAVTQPEQTLSQLALDLGYTDQSHFGREFRRFAGLTPGDYLARRPTQPFHVAVSRA